MKKKKSIIAVITNFFTTDIWLIGHKSPKHKLRGLFTQLQILSATARGYKENNCSDKASALTYYSILSVVPIIAMFFGIAKGFGYEKDLEIKLYEKFADKKEILDFIFEYANKMLENTQGGLIAGIGIIMLFWSVYKVLGNVESSFNQIWQIKKSRSFSRKISDYLSIMLLTPILFITSTSATIFVSNYIETLAVETEWLQDFGWLISFLINILPHSLIWFVFAFIYLIMPNTKVNIKAALVSGIFAGILFQIVQFVYIEFQVGVASYNAIYGSFAALPLFLIWMQTSWVIVLFGAELSFSIQNVKKLEGRFTANSLNYDSKTKLALYISTFIIKNFENGNTALTCPELASRTGVSEQLVQNTLNTLVEANILCELKPEDDKNSGYNPAIAISRLSVQYIISKLNNVGSSTLYVKDEGIYSNVSKIYEEFDKLCLESNKNILAKDL